MKNEKAPMANAIGAFFIKIFKISGKKQRNKKTFLYNNHNLKKR